MASPEINVTFEQWDEIPRSFLKLDARLRLVVRRVMDETMKEFTVERVRDQIEKFDLHPVKNAPFYSSITWEWKVVRDNSRTMELSGRVFSALDEEKNSLEKVLTIEHGMAPGAGGSGGVLGERITDWVYETWRKRKRPNADGRQLSEEQIAFVVTRKIIEEGIRPKPVFERAFYHIERGARVKFRDVLSDEF